MDKSYDELVRRLQAGHDSQCAMSYGMHEHCCDCSYVDRQDAADAITALQARVAELETELRRALAIAPSNAIAWQERAIGAELERDQYRHERDAYRDAMARMNAPAIALAALQPPPPIIMPAQDWELHQQIQTLNERIAYLEPIFIAARNLVDNAEEWECDGLGLFAQHGWWEPLHDALDPDGSAAADDIRQPVAPAK